MRSSKSNRPPTFLRSGIATLVVAMGVAIGTGTVHAAGTPSGTSISNLSTLNYSVGGTAQSPIGSSPTGNTSGAGTATTFVVDNRVNVTVVTNDVAAVSVVPGELARVTTFTVTNTGNTVQDFALASSQRATGTVALAVTDNFDTPACSQFAETAGGAGYQPAQDTAIFIDELAPDASRVVYVVCNIPVAQVNSDAAVVTLTATALAGGGAGAQGAVLAESGADTAGIDIVFGDAATLDDAARNANHSSRSAYRVVTAQLTVTKTSLLICDPLNLAAFPKRIPGSVVRWTITISNAAGAPSASLSTVTDAIVAATTFDANLITNAGTCLSATGTPENAAGRGFKVDVTGDTRAGYPKFFTTANDADGADLNGVNVTVNYAVALPVEAGYTAGELKAGESVVVYFNVTVN